MWIKVWQSYKSLTSHNFVRLLKKKKKLTVNDIRTNVWRRLWKTVRLCKVKESFLVCGELSGAFG